MPSFTALTRIFFVSAACCALFACGKANDQAPALSSVNKHPDTWLTGHRAAYRQNSDQCRGCHGNELLGGVTKIGCSANSCHSGNHPPRDVIHPVPFKGTGSLNKAHGGMAKKDLTICQDCHGTPGGAGSNPRFNLVFGTLLVGCESSGCHNAKMAHPKQWQTHSSSGNQSNACALCHGANFEGSTANGAPSCKSCHAGLTAGLVPVSGQCVSCHGNPPNSLATPNRAGSHAVHLALGGMSGKCSVCHTNGGSGTGSHGSLLPDIAAATVAFASNFNVSLGAASYAAATGCINVTCHGGQQTPAWYGGTIDVSASCAGCHNSGTTSGYLSYNSGKHAYHLLTIQTKLSCNDCHDMSAGANHFKDVTTTDSIETPASSTLRKYLNYNPVSQSCTVQNPPPAGVSFTACHSGLGQEQKWLNN